MRLVDCAAHELGFNRGEEFVLTAIIAFVWTMINLHGLKAYLKGKNKKTNRVNNTPGS